MIDVTEEELQDGEHNDVLAQWGAWLAKAQDEQDEALEMVASLKDEVNRR